SSPLWRPMNRRLRLAPRTVAGLPCPFPRVVLRVRDRYGALVLLPFRIDTGADCSAVPVSVARKEAIPFQETQGSTAAGLVGAAPTFRDPLRVAIPGREQDWP